MVSQRIPLILMQISPKIFHDKERKFKVSSSQSFWEKQQQYRKISKTIPVLITILHLQKIKAISALLRIEEKYIIHTNKRKHTKKVSFPW